MELILRIYLLPYNELKPVPKCRDCFDDPDTEASVRDCFLIGDVVKGLDMKPGQVKKEQYSYSKHGSCSVLAMISRNIGIKQEKG